ncbi:MAG: hypothetical protein AAFO82_16650 [Bacteroidota bacterium]
MDVPTQIFLMEFSGKLLENKGDVVELGVLGKKSGSIFFHFPIIESLLSTLLESKRMNIFIPRIESRAGLMKERVYDLTLETIVQHEQRLLKCTVEDLTEYYAREAQIQQKRQEEVMEIQTQA